VKHIEYHYEIKQIFNSIILNLIKNLVSFERYLLLVEEIGLSNLLIVDVSEGLIDG